jgi:hypothetical protein
VGEECSVFGGTRSLQAGGLDITLTSYFYVFRIGRVVAKLFVAQGPGAEGSLTPETVASLAERIVERIIAAGLGEEGSPSIEAAEPAGVRR